jgi:membrane-bound lytic murein transglycosylase F
MRAIKIIVPATLLFLTASCQKDTAGEVGVDLPQIKERGVLRAIVTNSSTSYFIYRGQPMGFEYELLERLAKHLNLQVELTVARNLDSLNAMLLQGKGDLVAHGMTITKKRKERVAFTEPYWTTTQVLVQRKPDNWRQMTLDNIEKSLIRNPLDLIGKKVYVRKKSSYYDRLQNLSEEMGGDIDIQLVSGDLTTEELIKMVARGEIDYTVADQDLAYINKTYDSDLDVKTVLSSPQRIAWTVRKSSPELLDAVNEWITDLKKNTDYYVIYNKYFRNRKAFRRRIHSEFFSKTGNALSPYDSLIQVHADDLGWDWRFLASMIYQESQFRPNAKSWAGAEGLMQILPTTAEHYGVTNLNDPDSSLDAGTAYLEYLQEYWEMIPDSLQRMKFVLASYNVGENHVADARRLAEKYGGDADRWDDGVDEYILKESDPEYYNDPVVIYGYCRGEEPYEYVREIFERYEHYKNIISLQPTEI